jgi:hypothetical protein
MLEPQMIRFVSIAGLLTGIIEALIARIWFRPIQVSLLIITGAMIGSWFTYFIFFIDPKVVLFNHVLNLIWGSLWEPLGVGVPSSGSSAVVLRLTLLTMLLVQVAGSIVGGLLGLAVWLKFLRY